MASRAPVARELAFAWTIAERAGEGASAAVWRVTRADGVAGALKVGRNEGSLEREARILARADRRWGPALLDAGVLPAGLSARGEKLEAGTPFLVTEWTEGQSLAKALRTTKDRETLAATVAHGVARALDELHQIGVRHGDVKAANVIVNGKRPKRDRARDRGATLIDLGLSTGIDAAAIGGPPRYLAPEIGSGDAAPPAADLHALGIVLAEILDPKIADADDPTPLLDRVTQQGEIGRWIAALVARAPGARPSAAWIAKEAARVLELESDPDEEIEARRARVRRAYLGARRDAAGEIDPRIDGVARTWLEESRGRAQPTHEPEAQTDAPRVAPLGPLEIARWLVTLVGPQTASWPVPRMGEGALAARLLDLAAIAPPEAWTLDDITSTRAPVEAGLGSAPLAALTPEPGTARAQIKRPQAGADDDVLSLTRTLLVARPPASVIDRAEAIAARSIVPASFTIDLATVLLRRGETGRALAAIAQSKDEGAETILLRAEIARRRGEHETSAKLARGLGSDRARALLARIAWERGDYAGALAELGDARGAAAAEVRGLVAYARGEHTSGIEIIEAAMHEPADTLGLARLEGARGMLEHARGRAEASSAAFARAVDLATRAGAVIEEATYLTGLAAAAVDAGTIETALASATRAALLWERLGRPAMAARAHLSRAAAYALVGAVHDGDLAAAEARAAAGASQDARAGAFARWAIVETRPPGDEVAREAALSADAELARARGTTDEDRIRAAARLLVWARGTSVGTIAIDERVAATSPAARWEWWGARAASGAPSPRVLAELIALLPHPAPLGSRGPALAAGVRLARELGDGDAARRLETARRAAADALRAGCPAEHRASLASIAWAAEMNDISSGPALGGAQVEQLEGIVRALSARDRLKPLLEQVLDTMLLWTGVERGLLLLRAPDGKLVPRTARNLARRDLEGDQLTLSMGLAKRAMEERQAICATDAFTQIGDLHASVHALKLRSVLAVPLVARGDVLGVVYLDDRVRRGAFGEGELAWVRLVASQAALAIADARDQALLRRAVRRAERASARLGEELGAREAELSAIRAELAQGGETRFRYDEIEGRSEPMRTMLKLVDRVTASEVPVLLVGESGTGKELVARAIHANGGRQKHAFVSENCASVPETLLESTLFGHVRGAFTGAAATRAGLFDVAHGGTLFLDEIGEMPLSMQTKLLRVLQNGEVRPVGGERSHTVDVRIIGATHRDLEAMVAAGTFREDLFYRLNVVAIRVPPLRERPQDIPLLVARFVEKHGAGRKPKVTRSAMDRLVAFPWPGNVRQLENEIRRAMVLADDRIDVTELSEEVTRGGPGAARDAGLGLKARVDALETQLVKDALARTKGNQTRAAEMLGVSRFGLQKMMRRLGIKGEK